MSSHHHVTWSRWIPSEPAGQRGCLWRNEDQRSDPSPRKKHCEWKKQKWKNVQQKCKTYNMFLFFFMTWCPYGILWLWRCSQIKTTLFLSLIALCFQDGFPWSSTSNTQAAENSSWNTGRRAVSASSLLRKMVLGQSLKTMMRQDGFHQQFRLYITCPSMS